MNKFNFLKSHPISASSCLYKALHRKSYIYSIFSFVIECPNSAGCIPADEIKFVLMHLPGKVTYKEIDEMIHTVDKNGDGKISFSEFRVMMGGIPLLIPNS